MHQKYDIDRIEDPAKNREEIVSKDEVMNFKIAVGLTGYNDGNLTGMFAGEIQKYDSGAVLRAMGGYPKDLQTMQKAYKDELREICRRQKPIYGRIPYTVKENKTSVLNHCKNLFLSK